MCYEQNGGDMMKAVRSGSLLNVERLIEDGYVHLNNTLYDLTNNSAELEGLQQQMKCASDEISGATLILPTTALIQAVECNFLSVARLLIRRGADVNGRDAAGNTALFYAARRGDTNAARLLIKNGANLNLQSNNGDFPLATSASKCDAEMVKFLTDAGANVNLQTKRNETALLLAVRKDSVSCARILIDKGASVNTKSQISEGGTTALLEACRLGNRDIIELLLSSEGNIASQSNQSQAGILIAVSAPQNNDYFNQQRARNYCSIVDILAITYRFKAVNAVGPSEMSVLMYAVKYCSVGTVRLILDNGASQNINQSNANGETALMLAVSSNNDQTDRIVDVLLDYGIDLEAVDLRGKTAVMEAARRGRSQFVIRLYAAGADVDKVLPGSNYTAIVLAAINDHADVVEFLLTKTKSENSKRKALIEAASQGRMEVVLLLQKNGIDINAKDDDTGLNALLAVADGGIDRSEMIPLLIGRGADVNATDSHGATTLMYLANWGEPIDCEVLIHAGADVHATDANGLSAASFAAMKGRKEITDLLIKYGANTNQCKFCNFIASNRATSKQPLYGGQQ